MTATRGPTATEESTPPPTRTATKGLIEREAAEWQRIAGPVISLRGGQDPAVGYAYAEGKADGLRRALEIIEQGEVSETLTEEARP